MNGRARTSSRPRWRQELPAWSISVVFHVVLLILLAGITWQGREPVEREIVIDLREHTEEEGLAPSDASDAAAEASDGVPGTAADATGARAIDRGVPEPPEPPRPADLAETRLAQPTAATDATEPTRSTDPALALLAGEDDADPGAFDRGPARTGAGAGGGFQRRLGAMQQRGLDVVFVLDATGNMGPFIGQTQQRIEQIVGVLTGMIEPPDGQAPGRGVRFGIVAFKDYGDEYGINASIHQPLTDDRDQLRHFVDQIVVGGGGDQTEPIHEALRVATNRERMGWRRNSEAVIVLVTEAPVHLTGREAAMRIARRFHQQGNGRIHVIDVGAVGQDGRQRVNVLEDLQNIARLGGGQAFLLDDEQAFWRQMIISIFGQRYEQDVEAIVRRYADAPED